MVYKLTEKQIIELINLRKKGYKLHILAKKFNISLSTVKRFINPQYRENLNNQIRERYNLDKQMRDSYSKTIKKWYKNNKDKQNKRVLEYYYDNKLKWNSRSKTYSIINSKKYGKTFLIRNCKICGSGNNIEIHHEIYLIKTSEILDAFKNNKIYFLCQSCHRKIDSHKKLKQNIKNK